ncbi:MAG: phosphoribosyl-ATP diphosphatase [Nannocystaceae bacterium]
MTTVDADTLGHILAAVSDTIEQRKRGEGKTNAQGRSYVQSLLEAGTPAINGKIREEAEELCHALAEESDERVSAEAADLLFHAMIGLSARGLSLETVGEVLRSRFGRSGVDEKASRSSADSAASPSK